MKTIHSKKIDPWKLICGIWKNKKVNGLKYQKKVRQEWKNKIRTLRD